MLLKSNHDWWTMYILLSHFNLNPLWNSQLLTARHRTLLREKYQRFRPRPIFIEYQRFRRRPIFFAKVKTKTKTADGKISKISGATNFSQQYQRFRPRPIFPENIVFPLRQRPKPRLLREKYQRSRTRPIFPAPFIGFSQRQFSRLRLNLITKKKNLAKEGRWERSIYFQHSFEVKTKLYWLDQTSASETRQISSFKISTKLFKISIKLQLQLFDQTSEPASLSTSTKISVLTHHAVWLTVEQCVNKMLTKVVIE